MLNTFLESDCLDILLPAVAEDQDCVLMPRLSQVVGLLILPAGVPGPANWASQTDMEGLVDNTDTVNAAAKFMIGKGSMEDPVAVVVNFGRQERRIARRTYNMEFQLSVTVADHYDFIRTMQRQYRQFRFWFGTLGGRVLGGTRGIKPVFVDAFTRYGGANTDTEIGIIRIEWHADGDPARTDMPGLFGVSTPYGSSSSGLLGGGSGGSSSSITFKAQAFPAQGSAVLTWTENGGVLPTTNTQAQVLVWMNGVKLIETTQYTISGATITISSDVHFSGAYYEVLAIISA